MSAKIYSHPDHIKKPKINWEDFSAYQKEEDEFVEKLRKFCKEDYAPNQDQNYIGELITFPVADSQAVYMVMSLSPLKLMHVPIGDAWEYRDADLYTTKRVKEVIDAKKRLDEHLATVPTIGEVNAFLKQFATEVYDMPLSDLELKMDDHICIKWKHHGIFDSRGEVEYFVPKDHCLYGEQEEKVYDYLNKKYHV